MPYIELTTLIRAPLEVCFNKSLDVQLHELTMQHTNEKAVAGRTRGICELNDTITWQAKHFGVVQQLTVKITRLEHPHFFEDTMLKGAFAAMRHEHYFEAVHECTEMKDKFYYEVPYGLFGKIFDRLVLHRYMTRLLLTRNRVIKENCEQAA